MKVHQHHVVAVARPRPSAASTAACRCRPRSTRWPALGSVALRQQGVDLVVLGEQDRKPARRCRRRPADRRRLVRRPDGIDRIGAPAADSRTRSSVSPRTGRARKVSIAAGAELVQHAAVGRRDQRDRLGAGEARLPAASSEAVRRPSPGPRRSASASQPVRESPQPGRPRRRCSALPPWARIGAGDRLSLDGVA